MISMNVVALAAQLMVAGPDTSLVRALVLAIDTAATAEGRLPLADRTFLVDTDRFHMLTGDPRPARGDRLPVHWKSYDEDAVAPCPPTRHPCITLSEVRVGIGGVERDPRMGTLLIYGSLVYRVTPPVPMPGQRVPVGGTSSVRFRNFSVLLSFKEGQWRIVEAATGEAA